MDLAQKVALVKRHKAGEYFWSLASREKGLELMAEGSYQGEVGQLWRLASDLTALFVHVEECQIWEGDEDLREGNCF